MWVSSRNASEGEGKLLNMILDPASFARPCQTQLLTQSLQWRTEENTDVMHINTDSFFAIRMMVSHERNPVMHNVGP